MFDLGHTIFIDIYKMNENYIICNNIRFEKVNKHINKCVPMSTY